LISVIIPAFNEEENIKELLPLLDKLAKGFNVEIIVSIGECVGNYTDCIKESSNARLVSKGRKGRAKQMNIGAFMSKGNTLVFLHADVRPPHGFFKDIQETLSQDYEAGFFSYRFDKDNFFLRMNASFTGKDGLFTGGGDQCLFIKKSVFEDLNGFDEEQIIMEDFEFFKRMKNKKISYTIIQNDLIVSARKYIKNSYTRVNLTNLMLVVLFKLGAPSHKLKSLHDKCLRLNY